MNHPLRSVVPMAVVAMMFAFASCTKKNPVDPGDTALRIPKAGSSYTFNSVSISGGTTVESGGITTVVMQSGLSYGGKSNVATMMTDFRNVDYYSYEGNGDVGYLFHLVFGGTTVDSMWIAFPIASRGSVAAPTYDRVYNGQHMLAGGRITYLGAAQLTVPAGTFQTQLLEFRTSTGSGTAGQEPTDLSTFVDTLWYAPGIGYHVRQSGVQTRTVGGRSTNYYSTSTLQQYTLQ
ncbi:MAG: hypothetical protein JST22_01755 [Bacteroidetes bacterium]|nr:hypothetical protein [Bacteroidota bacterium]